MLTTDIFITPSLSLLAILNLLGAAQGVLLTLALLSAKGDDKIPDRLLAALTLTISIIVSGAVLLSSYYVFRFPHFSRFDASITGNVNDWFGLVADVGGQYTRLEDQGFTEKIRTRSFLFGPRFSLRRNNRVVPFAHALFGVSQVETETNEFGPPLSFSDRSFGMAFGGGLDIEVNEMFAIRAIQADYLQTRFFGGRQNKGRISVGIVLRFGRK